MMASRVAVVAHGPTGGAGLDQASATLLTGEYLESWLAHVHGRVRATTYEG